MSHNKLTYTRICLESLLRTDYPNWELIVIDNGSTDGSREWLEKFKAETMKHDIEFKLICNENNIGCSTSRNQGINVAEGDFITFCDNDVALRSRDWLTLMSDLLASKPESAMVGPKLVYPLAPYNIQCAGAAVSKSGRVQFIGRGESKNDKRFNSRLEVQCLISACCMVKKSVLDKVGGFDEVFNPVEYEDIDLCYRIRSNGFSIWYEPTVEIYHFESVTTEGTPTLPNTYLIIKHGMIFKDRWKDMFGKENGPTDEATKWRTIAPIKLSEIDLDNLPEITSPFRG